MSSLDNDNNIKEKGSNGVDILERSSQKKNNRLSEIESENLLITMTSWWRDKAHSQTVMVEKIKKYCLDAFDIELSLGQCRSYIKRMNEFIKANYQEEVSESVWKYIEALTERLEHAKAQSTNPDLPPYLQSQHAQRADRIVIELLKLHPACKTDEVESKPTEINITFTDK